MLNHIDIILLNNECVPKPVPNPSPSENSMESPKSGLPKIMSSSKIETSLRFQNREFLRPRYGWLLVVLSCISIFQVVLVNVPSAQGNFHSYYILASGSHTFAFLSLILMGGALIHSVFAMSIGRFIVGGAMLMVFGPFLFVVVTLYRALSYWGGP